MSLNKPLDAITEDDLLQLKSDRVAEDQTVDYKKILHLDAEATRSEFRADVSSFANTSGGHLVIGMAEEEGFPIDLCGMNIPNLDTFKIRVDDILQTKISPRIPFYAVRVLPLSIGKVAVVIRIPQSFAKPHQITVNKDDFQFWARNSAGKYRLSVDELRSIILQSETLAERIRTFRLERLSKIIAGETPVPLVPGARTVFHMVPLNAFGPAAHYDVSTLERNFTLTACPSSADASPSSYRRYNLEGLLSVDQASRDAGAESYLQVFRNGILEGVEALSINWSAQTPNWGGHDEKLLINAVDRGMALQKHLGVEPPVVVFVTLIGVKGYTIYRGQRHFFASGAAFDRDTLLLPDVRIDSLDTPALEALHPILDAIWNAGGYARCFNINAEGKHVPPQ